MGGTKAAAIESHLVAADERWILRALHELCDLLAACRGAAVDFKKDMEFPAIVAANCSSMFAERVTLFGPTVQLANDAGPLPDPEALLAELDATLRQLKQSIAAFQLRGRPDGSDGGGSHDAPDGGTAGVDSVLSDAARGTSQQLVVALTDFGVRCRNRVCLCVLCDCVCD